MYLESADFENDIPSISSVLATTSSNENSLKFLHTENSFLDAVIWDHLMNMTTYFKCYLKQSQRWFPNVKAG
jgi:hypothetical protein